MGERRYEDERDREHHQHIYVGEPDEDLIEALEPDQLVHAMDRPVQRRQLRPAVSAGLWVLRVVLLLISSMVVYVFVNGLFNGGAG